MTSVQVSELKSRFSEIIKQVELNGEEFVIEYGRSHKKVAKIVPYVEEEKRERTFGILDNGEPFEIGEDFEMDIEEFLGL